MDSPVRTSSRCLPPAPKKESAKSRFGDEWSKPKTARVVLYDKAGVSRDFDIIQRVASGSYGIDHVLTLRSFSRTLLVFRDGRRYKQWSSVESLKTRSRYTKNIGLG